MGKQLTALSCKQCYLVLTFRDYSYVIEMVLVTLCSYIEKGGKEIFFRNFSIYLFSFCDRKKVVCTYLSKFIYYEQES